ncbi:MAG: hypothetical protein HZY76_14200 [Anaerolineae bacterium]|nr:MAG: hypothetical protein HZY76_14200 [Anaerolineae bacterium]
MYFQGSQATLTANGLRYNRSTDAGGGMYIVGQANVTFTAGSLSYNQAPAAPAPGSMAFSRLLRGNQIVRNQATNGEGGGLWLARTNAEISYNQFVRNRAANGGCTQFRR